MSRTTKHLKVLRFLAFILVPLLFIGFLALGFLKTASPKFGIGDPAPEFTLPLAGATTTFDSETLRGRPVVVNYWASWCLPCREEAVELEEAWRHYRDQGVQFLGINVQDTERDALDFMKEFDITYPVVRDANQVTISKFGVTGIPETFFIDHNYRFAGIEASEQIGMRGSTVVRGAISSALLTTRIEELITQARGPR